MTPRRDYRAKSVGFEYPSDEPPEFDTIALRTAGVLPPRYPGPSEVTTVILAQKRCLPIRNCQRFWCVVSLLLSSAFAHNLDERL